MPNNMMCCLICQKAKLLVYNKKDADPHFEINGTDVSRKKTIHLGNVLSTTDKYELVFDGIKKLKCSVNRFMSEFGSPQTVAKHIVSSVLLYIVRISTMATDMIVLTRWA